MAQDVLINMSFREWRSWLASFPWSLQWFIYLLLFRPVLDLLFFLKDISPFLSPAYLVGVSSPLVALYALVTTQKTQKSMIDNAWLFWTLLVCINAVFIIENDMSLDGFGAALKVIIPVYLYFVFRRIVKNKKDLQRLLQTFLFSLVVPAVIFVIEVLVGPLQEVESSRELQRIAGGYADVTNYGFYLTLGLIIAAYFFFVRQDSGGPAHKRTKPGILVLFIIMMGGFVLIKINHAASFASFTALLLLIIFYMMRRLNMITLFGLLILLFVLYFSIGEIFEVNITRIIATDIEVLKGERLPEQAFHGRMLTWMNQLAVFGHAPTYAHIFGLPLAGIDDIIPYVLVGPHNDFLRIMYTTGIAGLLLYLVMISLLTIKGRTMPSTERFLLFCNVINLLLYSLTTTPTIYYIVMPIVMAVFAYTAIETKPQVPQMIYRSPSIRP